MNIGRDIDDLLIVEVKPGHGPIRLWIGRLFLDCESPHVLVEVDDTVTLGIGNVIGEYGRSGRTLARSSKHLREAMTEEDIVAEDEARRSASDEIRADRERLGQTFWLGVNGISDVHSPLGPVTEQLLELSRIVRGRNHQHIANSAEHQRRE